MSNASFSLIGDKELAKFFDELPDKLQRKYIRQAMRAWAAHVTKRARRNLKAVTTRRTGNLSKSIKTKLIANFKKGIVKGATISTQPLGSHSHLIEYGWLHRTHDGAPTRQIPARPWMQPALEESKQTGRARLQKKIREGIEKEKAKGAARP